MSKPVGYYANYTPFDGSLIDQMVEYFGDQFQNMTPTEKCWLLYRIGYHLWFHDAEALGVRSEVENAMSRIESELGAGDKLALTLKKHIPSP
ncbi:hypothetical protein [Scytonema sp. PCC 10023]|uniref:hypothetical protein n=1 Tax=Scytonema sp. PCC 10023 TaxID=1680591 RepID=UPI0039C60A8B